MLLPIANIAFGKEVKHDLEFVLQNELLERLAVLTEQVNQLDEMRSRLTEAEGSVQASEASQKELQQQMAAASDRVGQLQVMLRGEKEKSGTLQADAERMVTRVELLESQLAQVADERAELTQRAHDQETTLRNQLDEANTLCQRYKVRFSNFSQLERT